MHICLCIAGSNVLRYNIAIIGLMCSTTATLEKVHKHESMVLEYWALRKRQQDSCLHYLEFESSSKKVREITTPKLILGLYY